MRTSPTPFVPFWNSTLSMGDQLGQLAPSTSRAYTAAGSAGVVAVLRMRTMRYMYHPVQSRVSVASTSAMTTRDRLLAATMEHVVENGVGELTLRGLAEVLGTSHR